MADESNFPANVTLFGTESDKAFLAGICHNGEKFSVKDGIDTSLQDGTAETAISEALKSCKETPTTPDKYDSLLSSHTVVHGDLGIGDIFCKDGKHFKVFVPSDNIKQTRIDAAAELEQDHQAVTPEAIAQKAATMFSAEVADQFSLACDLVPHRTPDHSRPAAKGLKIGFPG